MRTLLLLLLFLAAPARAQTTTHMLLPSYGAVSGQTRPGTANQIVCATYVAPFSMTNATKLAQGITGGSSTCGAAIYPDSDSGTALASISGSCASQGVFSATGLTAFSLSAGVAYRVCTCATATSGSYAAIIDNNTAGGRTADMLNTFGSRIGTAANNCSAGVPPSTTGVITPSNAFQPPLTLVEP
jgi:hypothetical protein